MVCLKETVADVRFLNNSSWCWERCGYIEGKCTPIHNHSIDRVLLQLVFWRWKEGKKCERREKIVKENKQKGNKYSPSNIPDRKKLLTSTNLSMS